MEITASNKITGRTAQAITAEVNRSGQTVLFRKDGRTVNAGSLLGVLSLVILPGDTVEVIADEDTQILNILKELF